jgi:hypothetical protein
MLCAIGGVGVDPFSSFHVEVLRFNVTDGAVLFNKLCISGLCSIKW